MKNFLKRIGSLIHDVLWYILSHGLHLRKGKLYQLLGKSKLSESNRELLALMRQDNLASGDPFRASEYWINKNYLFDDLFHQYGLSNIESQAYDQFFAGPPADNYSVLRYASYLLYQKVKSRDHLGLLDKIPATVAANSGLGFVFENHYVSWNLLISIDAVYSMEEADGSIFNKPVVLVDLGAGWGRIGHILKAANPNCIYVDCDLPEGLLVASNYLPQCLPNEKVYSYAENRNVEQFTKPLLSSRIGLNFCGTQDLTRFADKSIDVFVNCYSFQEMSLDQVKKYFNLIDTKVKGVLFLQEYWKRGVDQDSSVKEISGFDAYPFPAHWKPLFVRNVSNSDLYFEAAYLIP